MERLDGKEIARAVAADVASFYGSRLRRVLLFGSFARGEAGADSDVDLLVVLDRVDDYWKERERLIDLTWPHVERHGRDVSAFPVAEADFATSELPLHVEARRQGVDAA